MEIKAIPHLKWLNWFSSNPHAWSCFQKETIWKSAARCMKFQQVISKCQGWSKHKMKNTSATLTTPARAQLQRYLTRAQPVQHEYSHWSQYFKLFTDLSTVLNWGQKMKLPEFGPSLTAINKDAPLLLEPPFLVSIYLSVVSPVAVLFPMSLQLTVPLQRSGQGCPPSQTPKPAADPYPLGRTPTQPHCAHTDPPTLLGRTDREEVNGKSIWVMEEMLPSPSYSLQSFVCWRRCCAQDPS